MSAALMAPIHWELNNIVGLGILEHFLAGQRRAGGALDQELNLVS